MERFVSFHLCLSVGIRIVSPSASLVLFHLLHLGFSVCVIYARVLWPLTPSLFLTLPVISARWVTRPSLFVQPLELRVGGSKLSIKCFCWGREKIWYSGETKVICTRKFNCLSPASLSLSSASPPNQFHMKARVQMRFNCVSASSYPLRATVRIRWQCFFVFTWKSLCGSANFLTGCRESRRHNRRKLPLLAHKADVVLQEVEASIGNNPLCYSVKVPDPSTAAVNTSWK